MPLCGKPSGKKSRKLRKKRDHSKPHQSKESNVNFIAFVFVSQLSWSTVRVKQSNVMLVQVTIRTRCDRLEKLFFISEQRRTVELSASSVRRCDDSKNREANIASTYGLLFFIARFVYFWCTIFPYIIQNIDHTMRMSDIWLFNWFKSVSQLNAESKKWSNKNRIEANVADWLPNRFTLNYSGLLKFDLEWMSIKTDLNLFKITKNG